MATIEIAAIRLVMPEAMGHRCETIETDPRHHVRRRLIPELDGLLRGHQTCRMEPRLTLISLVVRDLVVSRRFYIDGLGWPIEFEVPEEVVMVRLVPGVVLSLWQEDKAKGELGTIGRTPDALPFALAHNVGSEAEVDAALDEASAAGASIPTPAIRRDWGGYSGYFVDPDGFRWEVAYNPGL
ncbi:MAG: VOC family protein [Humibacter sp.]